MKWTEVGAYIIGSDCTYWYTGHPGWPVTLEQTQERKDPPIEPTITYQTYHNTHFQLHYIIYRLVNNKHSLLCILKSIDMVG